MVVGKYELRAIFLRQVNAALVALLVYITVHSFML